MEDDLGTQPAENAIPADVLSSIMEERSGMSIENRQILQLEGGNLTQLYDPANAPGLKSAFERNAPWETDPTLDFVKDLGLPPNI